MFIIYKFYLNNELIIKIQVKKLKIKFKIDKDCIKIITKLSTPKNNS